MQRGSWQLKTRALSSLPSGLLASLLVIHLIMYSQGVLKQTEH